MSPHTNPDCPICRGRGWYESEYLDAGIQILPCPECNPVDTGSGPVALLIIVLLALLAGFVAWGMP